MSSPHIMMAISGRIISINAWLEAVRDPWWPAFKISTSGNCTELSIIIWDFRGMYLSGVPENKDNITIEDDSKDLEALMEAEDIPRAVVCGWSVGVQVALEHFRRRPDQVEALILHNGAAERVLHTSIDGKLAPWLLVPFVHSTRFTYPLVHMTRPLMKLRATARLARTGTPA